MFQKQEKRHFSESPKRHSDEAQHRFHESLRDTALSHFPTRMMAVHAHRLSQFFDRFFPADQQICISPCMRRICSVLVRYATAFLVRNTILRTPITLENLRLLFTFVEEWGRFET